MATETLKKALIAFAEEEFMQADAECRTQIWTPSEEFSKKTERIVKGRHRTINAKRILLIAAVVFLLSATAVFSFAQLRENIINTFREFYYTHFDVEYGNNAAGDITGDGIKTVYTLTSLPDGFEMTDYSKNDHSVTTVWENSEGETLILSQGDGITKRSVDNERLAHSTSTVDNVEYDIYSENGYILIMWNTAEYTFSLDYYGDCTIDVLINSIQLTEAVQ
ncbi:MAG: DUF4367 domain-containing protein [Clostridia bacterium]|nr:DUF4367 domain-containing protein [Clostridia bacterium]